MAVCQWHRNTLQCTATHYKSLPNTATRFSTLHHNATHCKALQNAATRRNICGAGWQHVTAAVRVHICVYVCPCMCVWVYACVCVHMSKVLRMSAFVYVCNLCVYARMRVCLYACPHPDISRHTFSWVWGSVCLYLRLRLHLYPHVYVCVCVCICVCVCWYLCAARPRSPKGHRRRDTRLFRAWSHTGIQLCLVCVNTGLRRLSGSLISIGHFLQKWPIFSGSFVENDLQLRGSYESSPLCTSSLTSDWVAERQDCAARDLP